MSGGVLEHDLHNFGGKEPGQDINLEIEFVSPFSPSIEHGAFMRNLLSPAPAVGANINTAGATSQLYAQALWRMGHAHLDGTGAFFNFGLGGTINNGDRLSNRDDRQNLGSHLEFYTSGELGMQLQRHWDVALYINHMSNGGIAKRNQSINSAGLRLGYRL